MKGSTWLLGVMLLVAHSSAAQCPWHRDIKELQSSCICAYNLGQELSVQCDMVDFSLLLNALDRHARTIPLDLLYVNNSTVIKLEDGAFKNLKLNNVQLSGCKIRTIAPGTFRGQEGTLRNLNLQDNELEEVPAESLRQLANLSLLDLSRNRIGRVPDEAFVTLHSLSTLKLSDNNLTLSPGAFRGLEDSLKNLNLKGTRQKRVPEAVRGLRTLAFLDLAQNGLRELPGPGGRLLEDLHSLTALNLERNLIQNAGADAFSGVNDTLSSLSLLNNLMTDFPTAAINSLTELRVNCLESHYCMG
jgi:Leucine-rich repeat (LRR) protein